MAINDKGKFDGFGAKKASLEQSNQSPATTQKDGSFATSADGVTRPVSDVQNAPDLPIAGTSADPKPYSQTAEWECASFPFLPLSVEHPVAESTSEHELTTFQPSSPQKLSTLIHAAWALVVSRMINSEGAAFDIAGFNESDTPSPLRVRLVGSQKISDYVLDVQHQESIASELQPQNDTNKSEQVNTILAIRSQQPGVAQTSPIREHGVYKGYALVIEMDGPLDWVKLNARFDSRAIQPWIVHRLLQRLEFVMYQIDHADLEAKVADIDIVTTQDLKQLWEWNATVPEKIQRCVHDVVGDQVKLQPDAPAICAWDGDLTYAELDQLSSQLAAHLVDLGVGPEQFVALCFEKSLWTSVAIIGVLKAGGAFVLLDPALPQQRLESIVEQTKASLILTSASLRTLGSELAQRVAVIDSDLFSGLGPWDEDTASLPPVSPSSAAYIVFTSGSTGVPKGATVSHSNLASALTWQKPGLGLSPDSRMYDFVSYSFTLVIQKFFSTLAAGACFCVPSDQDRKSNFVGSFAALKANTVVMTPSAAEVLSPENMPGLKKIGFGGEKIRVKDILPWWGKVEVFSGYGSSECTSLNVLNSKSPTPEHATLLGKGIGVCTWVVDPENHNYLLPPGCIGELIVEGPLVSRGYLNNPEKTAEVFIEDPSWLLKGAPGHAGRHGRFYKTGDLVKHHEDGTLEIIGRKDVQVKIRGQRVELGDVEHWVQKCVPDVSRVVAEVIIPNDAKSNPIIAAFLLLDNEKAPESDEEATTPGIVPVTEEIRADLAEHLPSYMIPTVFFSVREIPMTPTGKANRRQLRDMGSSFSIKELLGLQSPGRVNSQPESETERQLQSIWSQILKLDPEIIGRNSSFLSVGGDSIAAMKVVGEARKIGLALTVSDLLRYPALHLIAEHSRSIDHVSDEVAPFSLLGKDVDTMLVVQQVSDLYQLQASAIRDIYPCTPLQEGIVSLSSKSPGDYIMQAVIEIPHDVVVENLQAAWEATSSILSTLRTRIVQHNILGLLQVVLDEGIQWNVATGLDDYIEADREIPMNLGQPLVRYAIVKDDQGVARWMVWTINHAIYDGWAMFLILHTVNQLYQGEPVEKGPDFQKFIAYVNGQDVEKAVDYWKQALDGCHCEPFPALPRGVDKPVADKVLELSIPRPRREHLGVTESTMIRAAWALIQGRMTNTEDVVFGITVSGRNAPIPNMDRMVGPTIATVPLRIKLDGGQTVTSYTSTIQEQAVEMIPYEQIGLQQIAELSAGAQQATTFQTLLIVQPLETGDAPGVVGKLRYENQEQWFNTYAVMLEAWLGPEKIVMRATFDSRVIDSWTVEQILQRFEYVMERLDQSSPDQLLVDLDAFTPKDLDQLWAWNKDVPVAFERCGHELIDERAQIQPNALAVSAWDGEITYRDFSQLSDKLASHLVSLGIGPGKFVPLCFEKSMWTPVAMVSVLKAGAAFALLDPSLPEHRLKTITQELQADFILSSTANMDLSSRLCKKVVQVSADSMRALASSTDETKQKLYPNSPMFVVFTSGSTGVPKGVVLTHTNLITGLKYQADLLGFKPGSRVFDFASYAFDIAVHNVFAALTIGGCLCIPSDHDRLGNIEQTMAAMRVTIADITPAVSRLINPDNLPDLETLILAGEAVSADDVQRWWGKARVVNAYGPAECNISTVNADCPSPEASIDIGKGAGLSTWVVDPENHDRLLLPGSIGELLLEGPLVGQGYLNNPEKTASSFIDTPEWLLSGTPCQPGHRGRMYKTGDLVQYLSDGSLRFHGRKDAQVKIRGQRVELGEVEHYIQRFMPDVTKVAAEVIVPDGEKSSPMLVAFLQTESDFPEGNRLTLFAVPSHVQDDLSANLPRYMVPTIFFALGKLPIGPTGKMDRKLLRQMGSSLSMQELTKVGTEGQKTKRQPVSDLQMKMQQIWARVLGIESTSIGLDDSFLQLGGNSIGAIKLVGEARAAGLELTVADVFRHPKLHQVAANTHPLLRTTSKPISPFSLLSDEINAADLCQQVSTQYQILDSIQDIYPCTPLQEGLISLSTTHQGGYMLQIPFELPPNTNIAKFKKAWESVSRETPTLRTRIVQHDGLGLLQAVLDEEIQWSEANSVDECMNGNAKEPMELGQSLSRYALIKDETGAARWFVLTLHHALYDGWALPVIVGMVDQAYRDKPIRKGSQFQAMIQYIKGLDEKEVAAYWQQTFADYDGIPFPAVPESVTQPEADSFFKHKFEYPRDPVQDVTTPALLRAAWALVVGKLTNSNDVVYGATVSGRNAPIANIESIVGPVFATVPIRTQFDQGCSLGDYLKSVQQQATDMIPFEQIGLQNIAKISPKSQKACKIQTLLVIQPQETAGMANGILGKAIVSENYLQTFNPYGLMLEIQLGPELLTAQASFDSRIIESSVVENLLQQLDHVLQQFTQSNSTNILADIDIMTPQDLGQTWSRNIDVPTFTEGPSSRLNGTLSEDPILETEQPAYSLAQKIHSLRPTWSLNGAEEPRNGTNGINTGYSDVMLHSCGLDSISMMSLMHFVTQQFQVRVSLQLLMDRATTIRKLASVVASQQAAGSTENAINYEPTTIDLRSKISFYDSEIVAAERHSRALAEFSFDKLNSRSTNSMTVLLTGANGFIGTQILRQLLAHDQVKQVVAIVRGETVEAAKARTIDAGKKALWWSDSCETKLEVWKGDLSLPQLGLDQTRWDDLTDGVVFFDAIIHNGAAVHWVNSYEALEAVNVKSTLALLRVAVTRPSTRFVYVTGGVQGLSPDDREEDILHKLSSPDALGYSQTKFVAEAVVKRASDRRPKGMGDVSIVRPGLVVGTPTEGVANADDYLWRLVAASIRVGLYDTGSASEWISVSDVATVASVTVEAGLGSRTGSMAVQQIEDGVTREELWKIVTEMGYRLDGTSKAKWLAAINQDMEARKENHPLWPVAHVFRGESADHPGQAVTNKRSLGDFPRLKKAMIKSAQFLINVGFLPSTTGTARIEVPTGKMEAFRRSGM